MKDKRYHHENLREHLIETGIRILGEQGHEQLSIRKLAEACGVSHAAPYRHFADKESLLAAMHAHVERRFVEILQMAIEQGAKDPYPMVAFGKAYVRFFAENPVYYPFFARQQGIQVRIEKGGEAIWSNYAPFLIFKEQADKHLAAAHIPPAERATAMAGMWAIVHGLAGMATMAGVQYDGDWTELAEKVLIGVKPHA